MAALSVSRSFSAAPMWTRRVWKTKASASRKRSRMLFRKRTKKVAYGPIEPLTSRIATRRTGLSRRRRNTRRIGVPPLCTLLWITRRKSRRRPRRRAFSRRLRRWRMRAASRSAKACNVRSRPDRRCGGGRSRPAISTGLAPPAPPSAASARRRRARPAPAPRRGHRSVGHSAAPPPCVPRRRRRRAAHATTQPPGIEQLVEPAPVALARAEQRPQTPAQRLRPRQTGDSAARNASSDSRRPSMKPLSRSRRTKPTRRRVSRGSQSGTGVMSRPCRAAVPPPRAAPRAGPRGS